VDQFTRSLEIDPEYLSSYLERARAYEAMNDLQKAADDLQRALSFEQKKESLYYEAARLNYLLANYDNALELINRSLELKSNYEPAFRMQCLILLATGDYSGALISINKALALKDSPENNFYHGQVSENMKNYDQAETDYSKAISRNSKYTEAYLALASLRLIMNKPEAALENCNTVIAYAPGISRHTSCGAGSMPILQNIPRQLMIFLKFCMTIPKTRKCTFCGALTTRSLCNSRMRSVISPMPC
jgi:tetratricopeptide (TPR) repeat protein